MVIDKTKLISLAFITIAIITFATIISKSWRKTHVSYQTIAVTGLGQKDFKSDLIVWTASFSRTANTLSEASRFINDDLTLIKDILTKKGINSNEITFPTLEINRNYKSIYNKKEGSVIGNEFIGFTLSQFLTIESIKSELIEKVIRQISESIEKGIEFSATEPYYYYTKLKDLKVELLKQATENAYFSATTIAQNAKSSLGRLKNATMGVFQITAQNSDEDYLWGGRLAPILNTKQQALPYNLNLIYNGTI